MCRSALGNLQEGKEGITCVIYWKPWCQNNQFSPKTNGTGCWAAESSWYCLWWWWCVFLWGHGSFCLPPGAEKICWDLSQVEMWWFRNPRGYFLCMRCDYRQHQIVPAGEVLKSLRCGQWMSWWRPRPYSSLYLRSQSKFFIRSKSSTYHCWVIPFHNFIFVLIVSVFVMLGVMQGSVWCAFHVTWRDYFLQKHYYM